jgi:hypothetical protein
MSDTGRLPVSLISLPPVGVPMGLVRSPSYVASAAIV